MGYGAPTCATCDGAFFWDEDMGGAGGGEAALEEASLLSRCADTVYFVHRRESFRAEDYWIDRMSEHADVGDIEVLRNTEAVEVHGSPETGVDHVTLVRHPDGHPTEKPDDPSTEQFEFNAGALFVAIGHTPNTDYLKGTDVELDERGYVLAAGGRGGGRTRTGVPGLFAAGDVVDYHYQQAVTAGGMGCKAAIDADEYLESDAVATDASADPAKADD
jgi:thioredoxin reductase (NADPH)